jgi:hypothetical protein
MTASNQKSSRVRAATRARRARSGVVLAGEGVEDALTQAPYGYPLRAPRECRVSSM